jgi:ring-1,2-phenylacetyl-CoA epoxidase subunit PaaD
MSATVEAVWAALEDLADPEIPVISLRELGILRDVRVAPDGLEVVITPTYSGCPAMSQIEDDIRSTLLAKGITARVVSQLSPAWTTDWMSESGKEKLRAYGIAPPHQTPADTSVVRIFARPDKSTATIAVPCPHCGSSHTVVSSQFGSTACKALYKCLDCQEPFDYFKPY